MRFGLLALLLQLTGCSFSPKGPVKQPIWLVKSEGLQLGRYNNDGPVAIPAKRLLVCVTSAGFLVAYDVSTGKQVWISKFYVSEVYAADASAITVHSSDHIFVLNTLTGEVIDQKVMKPGSMHSAVLSGMEYGVSENRLLLGAKDDKLVWRQELGFVPNEKAVPERYRDYLILRGMMKYNPIGFFRVYSPGSGKLLWDVETELDAFDPTVIPVSAQLAGDRAVIFREGVVTSHDLATGKAIWSAPATDPAVATSERVFVLNQDSISVHAAQDGKVLRTWTSPYGVNPRLSAAGSGVLYAAHAHGRSTLGGMKFDFWLSAMDERSGRILWRSEVDTDSDYAPPMVFGDHVVVVSQNKIYAISR